jgi:shikimate 5-dehydrogenase
MALLGAGGTAHAACYALQQLGGRFFILNRTSEKAEELAKSFGGIAVTDVSTIDSVDVIISTVPPAANFTLPQRLVRCA